MSCGNELVYQGVKKTDSTAIDIAVSEQIYEPEEVEEVPKIAEPVKLIVSEEVIRKAVFDTAFHYSKFVRERGPNKHPAIVKFNRPLQIPLNSAYCSTFGVFCWMQNGIRIPKTNGLAYSWRVKSRLVWHRGMLAIDDNLWPRIKIFDAVVYTWSHVGFVAPVDENSTLVRYSKRGIMVVGANTTGGVKRVEGVYYPIYRSMNFVYGIYDHFTPLYEKDPEGVSNQFLERTKSI